MLRNLFQFPTLRARAGSTLGIEQNFEDLLLTQTRTRRYYKQNF